MAWEKSLEASAFRRGSIHLTVEDPRWKGRLREVLRVRELFAAAALGSDEFKTSLQDLDRYFDFFAWLARSDR